MPPGVVALLKKCLGGTPQAGFRVVANLMADYRRPDILVFGAADYEGKHRVADWYARKGHRVFFFSSDPAAGERRVLTNGRKNLYQVVLNVPRSRALREVEKVLGEFSVLASLVVAEHSEWSTVVEHLGNTHSLLEFKSGEDYSGIVRRLPKFSVLVEAKGGFEHIRNCVNSVIKWTAYPNYELIVIDTTPADGKVAKFLRDYEDCHAGVRVVAHDPDHGRAADVGFRTATGEYVVWLEDDVIVSRGWLSRTYAHFRLHPECGAVGMVTNFATNAQRVKTRYPDLLGFAEEAHERAFGRAFRSFPARHSHERFALAVKRESVGDTDCPMLIAEDVLVHRFGGDGPSAFGTSTEECEKELANNAASPAVLIERKMATGVYKGVGVIAAIPWNGPVVLRAQQMAKALARWGFLFVYVEACPDQKSAGTVYSPYPGVFSFMTGDFEETLSGVKGALMFARSGTLCWGEMSSENAAELIRDNVFIYEYIDHFDEKIAGDDFGAMTRFYRFLLETKQPVRYVATARKLQRELEERTGKHVAYIANGVDVEHFSPANVKAILPRVTLPECLCTQRPKIGYFGAIAPWLDWEMLCEVIRSHPEWDFIFIGPDFHDGQKRLPLDETNCHWLGPVKYADLPAYADRFDVAMLPFQRGDLARSTSPLKLFEYFALGKPVVVTPDMNECTAFEETLVGDGADGFALAIELALQRRRNETFIARLIQLAKDNCWDARARQLFAELGEGGESAE